MRKWLVIGTASLLVAVGAALLWPRDPAPEGAPEASSGTSGPAGPPRFAQVDVSSGDAEGLTLTGRVLDPRGQPLPDAEVFLAASAQKTLTSLRCDSCEKALLACPANETAAHVLAFFEEHQGFLTPRATTRTDAQGKFRFERLAGVAFSVWAKAPGHGVALRERAAPGEAVELFLPPLRSIAGQVRDDAGKPVAGARVRAVSRRTALPHEVTADGQGRFDLAGLGEGPFYVLASAQGLLPAVEPQVEPGPQLVRLKLTRPRTLEVRVTRGGAPAAATVRLTADHLSRELRATGGEPARFTGLFPDEVIAVAEAPGLGSTPLTVALDAPVTRVTLELEEAGKLLVTVVDEAGQPVPQPELVLRTARGELLRQEKPQTGALVEFGPLVVGDYMLDGQAQGFERAQLPARVKAGETPVELEMRRATVISGRVMDEYGRPAPGVSVLVQPTGETTLADAEGAFSVAVPSPGLYELNAHHSEWGGGSVKVTAPASGVELSLEPQGSLEVTVSSGGRRVEGADVILGLEREGVYRSDRPSGTDGVIPMRGLPPRRFKMVVFHPDYLPSEPRDVEVLDGQTQRLDVELPPGAPLTGQVVDTQGAPVEGATLTVVPRAAEAVVSDAQGHFEFRALRPDRDYSVDARHASYDAVERASGRPGGAPVKVVLQRRESFRGRVVAEDGSPVKRFRLDVHEVSTPDGRFEVALLKAGDRLIFTVDATGFEPQMVDRPVAPDLGDIVLSRSPSVTGRVRDESGAPVPDAVVSCDVCDGSVMAGPDGQFSLPSPPFVSQFILSARKGRLTTSQQVPQGARGPVELTLKPATRLHGVVYQPDGKPAAGFPLEGVQADRGEPITVVTGPDGSYSVDAAPGIYRFAQADLRSYSGEPMLIVQVSGADMRMDIGPAPGWGSLTVRLSPERGRALWLVAGDVSAARPTTQELMRSRYAQLSYQPRGETLTLRGLPPGRYTLIWASLQDASSEGAVMRAVDVPASAEVSLVR
ncbi:carboxypeptidase regulatory-like domain-containing protein [Myxococcaceae bacterium GXIMD 01537]